MLFPKPTPKGKKPRKPLKRSPVQSRKTAIPGRHVPTKRLDGLYGRPSKADRPGIRRRREIKKKDRIFQEEASGEGNCLNCGLWRPLVGDHIIKRRVLAYRHDPANRRRVCPQCNGEFESLSTEQLIKRYPDSPLQEVWREKMRKKGRCVRLPEL